MTEQRWEYKVILWSSWDRALLEQTLNELGSQGWEVTATMEETLVLKRPYANQTAD
jgi:hypothetical protein